MPSRTAVDIAPETVARLYNDIPSFVGVKETTKDFEHFTRVLQLCGRDLLVWSGIELLCLPLLNLGGVGFLSRHGQHRPARARRPLRRWAAGDQEGARDLHYGLHPLVDLLFVETNPAAGQMGSRADRRVHVGLRAPAAHPPHRAGQSKPGPTWSRPASA